MAGTANDKGITIRARLPIERIAFPSTVDWTEQGVLRQALYNIQNENAPGV
jgi:hypothetical protein